MANRTQRGSGVAIPEGPSGFKTTSAGLWTPQQTQVAAGNYARAYINATPTERKHGREFYPTWNEQAEYTGQQIGQSTAAGAALMAHLSPTNEAEMNRIQALQVVHGISDRQAGHIKQAAEHASLAKGAQVRITSGLKKDPSFAGSRFHRELADEVATHETANTLHRQKAGIPGTPLGMLGSGNIAKSLAIRQGEYEGDPMETLGRLKLRDFGGLIHDPRGYSRVPIDTHYHDLGIDRRDLPWKGINRGMSSVGRYESFQGAHALGREMAMEDLGRSRLSHGEFMATGWYHHLQQKAVEHPRSTASRAASETKIRNITSNSQFKNYLPETYGFAPALGKIEMGA